MNPSLEKIPSPFGLALLGVILLIIGALGAIPFSPTTPAIDFGARWFLGGLGMLLIMLAVFFVAREQTIAVQHNAISDSIGSPGGFLKRVNVRVFDFHGEAQPTMRTIICKSLQADGDTHIRVLGVGMHYSWPFLQKIVQDCLIDGTLKGKLIFEFAMLNENWPKENIFRDWSQRISHSLNEMRSFKAHYRTACEQGRIELRIISYTHMPSKHGVLIDNQTLFLSFCDIADKGEDGLYDLRVGDNRYELFRLGDKNGGTNEIRQFNQLFQYYQDTGKKIDINVSPG